MAKGSHRMRARKSSTRLLCGNTIKTKIMKKAIITATREELNREFLFEKFGFYPNMAINVKKPKWLKPDFYWIQSPITKNMVYSINHNLIKFI
jgi:hypothetical protein